MRKLFFIVLLVSYPNVLLYAADPPKAEGTVVQAPQVENTQSYKSVASELSDAVKFLDQVDPNDRAYIRFFTTYAVPKNKKIRLRPPKLEDQDGNVTQVEDAQRIEEIAYSDIVVPALNFVLHSLSSGQVFSPAKQITDTLFFIDIRDYNWTEQSFELVSRLDPYFREPLIDADSYTKMRIESGNSILRADWFIVHGTDVTKQVDRGLKDIIYYELLYSSNVDEKGNPIGAPKTLEEFRKFWGFEVDASIKQNLGRKTVVKTGNSPVALHNRDLYRLRMPTGYYWESQDVQSMVGNRNYIENLNPDLRKNDVDAGEIIASNRIGLQVYFLVKGNGERIDFAGNNVATDYTSPRDKRVRTSRSCMICHTGGINRTENALDRLIVENNVQLKASDKYYGLALQRAYLDQDFNLYIEDDRELFRRSIKKCNGLTPELNQQFYSTIMEWYEEDITLEQAAIECGMSTEEFKKKIVTSNNGNILSLLERGTIARESWEDVTNSYFAQAMISMYDLKPVPARYKDYKAKGTETETTVTNEENEEIVQPPIEEDTVKQFRLNSKGSLYTINDGQLSKVPINIPEGTIVSLVKSPKELDGQTYIRYNDKEGYVMTKRLDEIK